MTRIYRFFPSLCIVVIAAISALSIAVSPAYAEGERRLTLEAAFGIPYINGQMPGLMRISPDDKWLACTWADDARGYSELWLMSMDGAKRRKLTDTKELRRKELIKENDEIENVDERKTEDELTEALEHERNISQIVWDKDCRHMWAIYRGDLVRLDVFDESQPYPAMEKILKLGGAVGDIKLSKDGRYLGVSMYSEIYIRD